MLAQRLLVALAVVTLLAGGPTAGFAQHSGMDHSMHRMGPEIVIPAGARYTKADVEFMQGMIAHHGGALQMAHDALNKSSDTTVRRLAREIIVAQRAEIIELRRMLHLEGLIKPEYSQYDALFRF